MKKAFNNLATLKQILGLVKEKKILQIKLRFQKKKERKENPALNRQICTSYATAEKTEHMT